VKEKEELEKKYWRYLVCPILTCPVLPILNARCLRTGFCKEYLDLSVRKWREAVNLYASPNVVRVSGTYSTDSKS
jgi:hypothetical protein